MGDLMCIVFERLLQFLQACDSAQQLHDRLLLFCCLVSCKSCVPRHETKLQSDPKQGTVSRGSQRLSVRATLS
jgi:hypothetical protein